MDSGTRSDRPLSQPPLSVVILAGGRSVRYGADKLAASVRGRRALARVVARVRPLAADVFLSVGPETRPPSRRAPRGVTLIEDRPDRWGEGPAGAIANALATLEGRRGPILIVPGDIPWVESAALRRFASLAIASPAEVAAPRWGSGETEHLLQWHRSPATIRALPPRSGLLGRPWRASELLRAPSRTLFVPVGLLTRRPRTFSHLTFPGDAVQPVLRGDPRRRSVSRLAGPTPKRAYRLGVRAWMAGERLAAAHEFDREASWYRRSGLWLLALHAYEDAALARGTLNPRARFAGTP
jgi:molybdenum cofactor guanylyltransferase